MKEQQKLFMILVSMMIMSIMASMFITMVLLHDRIIIPEPGDQGEPFNPALVIGSFVIFFTIVMIILFVAAIRIKKGKMANDRIINRHVRRLVT